MQLSHRACHKVGVHVDTLGENIHSHCMTGASSHQMYGSQAGAGQAGQPCVCVCVCRQAGGQIDKRGQASFQVGRQVDGQDGSMVAGTARCVCEAEYGSDSCSICVIILDGIVQVDLDESSCCRCDCCCRCCCGCCFCCSGFSCHTARLG